jgi:hypothetical protein
MRLRALRLRVVTTDGPFGVDVRFDSGLVILRADNTSGKSTCTQAIVWALGLEGMYGPAKASPLTPAVLSALIDPDTNRTIPVVESSVFLELENDQSEVLTTRRWIKHERASTDLIQTWAGPALTQPELSAKQQDYYVRLPGAAQAPAGFHTMLARFLGWQLPTVLRNDGTETPLYLECIFPTAFVEQKRGWSGLFAVMPWHLRIPEMATRAIEYVLSLEAYETARRNREYRAGIEQLGKEWSDLVTALRQRVADMGANMQGVPAHPTADWPPPVPVRVFVAGTEKEQPLTDVLTALRAELRELSEGELPTVSAISAQATEDLTTAEDRLRVVGAVATQTLDEVALAEDQRSSLVAREEALKIDLQRYSDLRRLRELGSDLPALLTGNECPTCHQEVPDSLLSRLELPLPMGAEANVSLIREQLKTFEAMRKELDRDIEASRRRLTAIRAESLEIRSHIRALRRTLVSDDRQPAAATIERRIRLADRIERLEVLERDLSGFLDRLAMLAQRAKELATRRPEIAEALSPTDNARISQLERRFIQQLQDYGFASYPVETVTLSRVRYTPEHENVELSYGLSASDLIRSIWAYLIGLLEECAGGDRPHPGFLLFDEPRQLRYIGRGGEYKAGSRMSTVPVSRLRGTNSSSRPSLEANVTAPVLPACGGPAMTAKVIDRSMTLVAFCHMDGAVWFFNLGRRPTRAEVEP